MMNKRALCIVALLALVALACALTEGRATPTVTLTPDTETPADDLLGETVTPTSPDVATPTATQVPQVEETATAEATATVPPEATATRPPPTPTRPPATATPQPAPPTIVSFTADRTSFVQGEEVTVSWSATGGTEAFINWVGRAGILEGVGQLNPNGGSAVITPYTARLTLNVRNAHGTTTKELALNMQCPHQWVPDLVGRPPDTLFCPFEALYTWAAQQSFERGFMVWLQNEAQIYVFYNTGQYYIYSDTFKEGDPESDPTLVPPAGLLQPIRGFGKVWRENSTVRNGLGWATSPEQGFNTWKQGYQGVGMTNVRYWLKGIDGRIYLLRAMGLSWEVYQP